MNKAHSLVLLFIITLLTSCNDAVEVKELEFTKRVNGANSADAFRNTVHPILLKRCSSCHGDGGTNLKHSVSDYKEAHDVVVDGGKVDFNNPANSRLVDKLVSQQHNCWNGNCKESGAEMLAAIEEWIALRGKDTEELKGAKTIALKYKDAEQRAPETINGVVLIQAEDGILSGRFKSKTSSTASGYAYIAGDLPSSHPIEQTSRIGSIPDNVGGKYVACSVPTAQDLEESVNGLVRYNEQKRHASQEGYRYYSQAVSYTLIHPNHREDFLNALKNGTALNGNWYLRMGPKDENGDYTGGIRGYGGDGLRILPEFKDVNYFNSIILPGNKNSTAEVKNFFAPRFGESGIDFFQPTSEEVRINLPGRLKAYNVNGFIQNTFAKFFYKDESRTQALTEFNDITPYSLLEKEISGDAKYKTFVVNDLDVAKEFFDHYVGDLTESNALDVMGCTEGGTLSGGTCSKGTPILRVDTYVRYFVDPGNKEASSNFSRVYKNELGEKVTETFNLNQGTTNLDLTNILLDAGDIDKRSIKVSNYATILKPVLKSNCVSCHGNNSGGRPSFVNDNDSVAFDAINGLINFTTPGNSRPAQRMDEGHNCGGGCAQIKADIIDAIEKWKVEDEKEIAEAEANSTGPDLKSLSDKERTPGRARYKFTVTEAGDYNVWLKVLTGANKVRWNFQIRNAKTNAVVKSCNNNQDCATNNQAQSCRAISAREYPTWTWYTPGLSDDNNRINNKNNKIKWPLEEGTYYLDIYESQIDAKIDLVAISKNDEFNPRRNLIDEGIISSADPRILKYDLSKILKSPGFFEIEIFERSGGDSYAFRNPRFVGNKTNISVKNIKILINDKYEFTDSAYTKIHRVVGTNKANLTYAPLIALAINGLGNDSFRFVFEDLKTTNLEETILEDDIPVAINGRQCKKLELFKKSVKPILNRFRLIRKAEDGYTDYTSDIGSFPGVDRNRGGNAQFYTCTTCHNEEHPYFKMTTFLDKDELLCEQALSRVDFKNFDKSLMIRGLNGTFNHPKLHFVESVPLNKTIKEGKTYGDLAFKTNPNKVNGYDSSWAGFRFEKYDTEVNPNGDIDKDGKLNKHDSDMDGDDILNDDDADADGDGVLDEDEIIIDIDEKVVGGDGAEVDRFTDDQKNYLKKFIGQYIRIGHETITDPYAKRYGNIKLPGDTYDATSELLDKWTYAAKGQNLYYVKRPESYVNKQGDFDPSNLTGEGLLKVKDSCLGKKFGDDNGVQIDPCNSNQQVISEFEEIKTRYREAIINWMKEEAKAHGEY